LITRESEQKKLIEFIEQKNPADFKALVPSGERTDDEMINLVTGLHDVTEDAKQARKCEIDRIGQMVKV
jgi:hypothetical protein